MSQMFVEKILEVMEKYLYSLYQFNIQKLDSEITNSSVPSWNKRK